MGIYISYNHKKECSFICIAKPQQIIKQIFLVSTCIFLFACNGNKEKKASETPKNIEILALNLKGKVKQTEESITTIDSLNISTVDSMVAVFVFDSIGYQTESYTKDPSGKKYPNYYINITRMAVFPNFNLWKTER